MLNKRVESSPNSVRRRSVSTKGPEGTSTEHAFEALVWNLFCFAVLRRLYNPQCRCFSDGGTVLNSRVPGSLELTLHGKGRSSALPLSRAR